AGITAAALAGLRHHRVSLPGTVDSSPIYLHAATVHGATHDVIVLSTTYGRTVAVDANSAHVLWTYTPPGYSGWAGSAQITTATPLADPEAPYVYAASPDGRIHKLSLADGSEVRSGGWPVDITRDPTHEKLTAALNVDGPYLLASTGGYYEDAPPYQGHIVAIERSSGRLAAVFNSLCAGRHRLITPSSCPSSDSAVLSRSGPVVEPGGARILFTTGNGPWNGRSDFGDSAIELGMPKLTLRQAFTPPNQAELSSSDADLGSGSPALLDGRRVLVGGKDGILRVLNLNRLDGRPPSTHEALGGEVQRLRTPGGAMLFTTPCVWHHGSRSTVFVADEAGTAAYALRHGRLHRLWQSTNGGTSPVMVGGLLYVYDPGAGGINVYRPASPRPIAKLAGLPGHWNSPIVVDGHVIEPEGNANNHETHGTLDIFSMP
ncbi:MAG: PQQ-binding-like beta-propeller repeat protein, partial [Solirubrobacteraceae bacterium]